MPVVIVLAIIDLGCIGYLLSPAGQIAQRPPGATTISFAPI